MNETAIAAFKYTFEKLTSGESLMMPEASIDPVAVLPDYADLTEEKPEYASAEQSTPHPCL